MKKKILAISVLVILTSCKKTTCVYALKKQPVKKVMEITLKPDQF